MIPPNDRIATDAKGAGELFSLSGDSWLRLHCKKLCPPPRIVGKSHRWDVAELRAWSEAGCPTRRAWQRRRNK